MNSHMKTKEEVMQKIKNILYEYNPGGYDSDFLAQKLYEYYELQEARIKMQVDMNDKLLLELKELRKEYETLVNNNSRH